MSYTDVLKWIGLLKKGQGIMTRSIANRHGLHLTFGNADAIDFSHRDFIYITYRPIGLFAE